MSSTRDMKELLDLDFQVWMVRDHRSEKWRDQVYIMGSDDSLVDVKENLEGLLGLFQIYGKGTRKYKSNPPVDFDSKTFGKENGVDIRWLDRLVIRIGFDAMDNEPFIVEGEEVSISVNPNSTKLFIERINQFLDFKNQYPHGVEAVCGLRLSPDWVGAE